VTFHVKAGSAEVTRELPVQYRYVKDIYNGDKRMELNVVPVYSVRVTPPLEVIPAPGGAKPAAREVHVAGAYDPARRSQYIGEHRIHVKNTRKELSKDLWLRAATHSTQGHHGACVAADEHR
jgi:hypothetical protein